MSETTKSDENTEKAKPEEEPNEPEGSYLIRDCELYKDEYDECTSFRGRFHQYFIYGETIDCNQWNKDYNNCCKWTDSKDVKAANTLIESETTRRQARFRAHYANNTWTKRKSPPEDWDKPLPEWMVKRDENTFLAVKAQELKDGVSVEETSSYCCIM